MVFDASFETTDSKVLRSFRFGTAIVKVRSTDPLRCLSRTVYLVFPSLESYAYYNYNGVLKTSITRSVCQRQKEIAVYAVSTELYGRVI